jgi:hypothetical protein
MRTRRRRTLRRILALLLVTVVTVATFGFASSAAALSGLDVIDCGDSDAPMPASPYGDGSFIARPSTAETKLPDNYEPGRIVEETDPFRHPDDVSLESVYGTAPSWWVYDTGCMGRFVAGAGTALGNIELQISGIMPSWSHALLDTVIGDSELFAVLDAPVAAATRAVSEGVWGPWLPISLLAVAALVLWRARSGHLGGAVTAATTALVVLGLSSILMQYPTESVRWVDAGARNVTGLIAAGFSDGRVIPKNTSSESAATVAIDAQMDDLVRQTQYRTWLDGVFGDPDSAIARKYGPRVFRATHFSWAEHTTYRSDPNGEGKKILEAKQEAFKKYAEEIKQADPIAYETFTGKDWASRATSALVNLFVVGIPCVFLLLAGLFAVMGFVLIRLVVPLAPAAGVIFMYDKTRDLAVGWLKRVVGPLIMGPVCFLLALVLLRFTSAIYEVENMWFVLKLGLITVLTAIAFRLSGVLGMVPGYERARRSVTAAFGQAMGTAIGAARRTRDGLHAGDETTPEATADRRTDMAQSPGGVWHPPIEARAPAPVALGPPDGFVPYTPPPRVLGAGESAAAAGEPGARALQPSPSDPAERPDRYPGGYQAAWPPAARQQWVRDHLADPDNVSPENRSGDAYDYQRKHAGPDNVRLRSGETAIDADGVGIDPDKVVTIETKWVNKPGSSNALNEGRIPEFMKKKVEHDFTSEMVRYGEIINDPTNPVDRLRLTVSTQAAADYWGTLARKHLGPDADIEVRVEPN